MRRDLFQITASHGVADGAHLAAVLQTRVAVGHARAAVVDQRDERALRVGRQFVDAGKGGLSSPVSKPFMTPQ